MTRRINMWSGPRSLSTAMMYSWRQRTDTTVVDEPFYAYYLAHTGRDHPGLEEVLVRQCLGFDGLEAPTLEDVELLPSIAHALAPSEEAYEQFLPYRI